MAFPWFDHDLTIRFTYNAAARSTYARPPLSTPYSIAIGTNQILFSQVLITDNQSNETATFYHAAYSGTYLEHLYTSDGNYNGSTSGILWRGNSGVFISNTGTINYPTAFIQEVNADPNTTHTGTGSIDYTLDIHLESVYISKKLIDKYIGQDGIEQIQRTRYFRAKGDAPQQSLSLDCDIRYEGEPISSGDSRHYLRAYYPTIPDIQEMFHSSGAFTTVPINV
ncbi:MAG: hypothetical protein IJG83_01410 [Thermoguttaceae bacterium]|nr:hypothetical protein [Thermoguttaceae bacterium]